MSVKIDALNLIERKLQGSRRQEALRWAKSYRTTNDQLLAFMKKLEGLPDTGALHSNTVHGLATRAAVRGAYQAGDRVDVICDRHKISHETLYRFAALFGLTSMGAAAWLGSVAAAVGLLAGDGQVRYGWDAFWPVFTMVNTANIVVMLAIVAIVGMIAWAERGHP